MPPQRLPLRAWLHESFANPQAASPFFRLPRELRDKIYSLVLSTLCDEDSPYPRSSQVWRPDLTGRRFIPATALLRTCRLVYMETWDRPVLETTLVIHEGSHEDRPRPKARHYHIKPARFFFHFQSWHCLLLQRMDLTFQQIRLEGNGLEEWIKRIEFSKRHARRMMKALAEQADARIEKNGGQARVMKFVQSYLMPLPVRSIAIRINRMDWWRWSDKPIPEGDELDAAIADGNVLRLLKPELIFQPRLQGEILILPADDFELKLILETWGPKVPQLDHVVANATSFTFQIPTARAREDSGEGEDSIGERMLTWDGNLVHLEWKHEGDLWHRWSGEGEGWDNIHRCVVRFA
jgi:hypothetical protein